MDILYCVDGSTRQIIPKNGTDYSLKELQGYVGGYIEIVTSPLDGEKVMVLDEEGKIKNKPVNVSATEILQSWGYNDFAVGDVMVVNGVRIK